jgi:DNA-binding transcriptional LysR family regulator
VQLRHVEYFVATADAGSVSGAARDLHVTQPALSRQLRQLEGDLGVHLFDRDAGRLTLSRSGAALLPAARDLLAAAGAVRAAAAFSAAGRVERFVVAAPTGTLTDLVSPFVATMSPDEPVVDVRSADDRSPAQALRDGADLTIGAQRPPAPYRSTVVATLPVWACVRPDHPWAARRRVPLAQLLEQPLVALPTSAGSRQALDAAAGVAGRSYATLVEAANGTIAQALAAAGRGVAVVADEPRYDLCPVAVDLGDRTLSLRLVAGWDPRSVAAPAVEALAGRLGAFLSARYGTPAR